MRGNRLSKIAGLLTVSAASLLLSSCALCNNEKLAEYPSPSGRLKVIVFERDCGATTDFSTQASVVPAAQGLPGGGGNLFVGAGGGPELRVRWIDDRTVELAYDARARVFKSESLVAGVRARFVTFR